MSSKPVKFLGNQRGCRYCIAYTSLHPHPPRVCMPLETAEQLDPGTKIQIWQQHATTSHPNVQNSLLRHPKWDSEPPRAQLQLSPATISKRIFRQFPPTRVSPPGLRKHCHCQPRQLSISYESYDLLRKLG